MLRTDIVKNGLRDLVTKLSLFNSIQVDMNLLLQDLRLGGAEPHPSPQEADWSLNNMTKQSGSFKARPNPAHINHPSRPN